MLAKTLIENMISSNSNTALPLYNISVITIIIITEIIIYNIYFTTGSPKVSG